MVEVTKYKCGSCGAPLELKHRFTKVVVCKYCRQTSFITKKGIELSDKKTELLELNSIFTVGLKGEFGKEKFEILGHIRYRYDGGEWDEFLIQFNNEKKLWLQEDEGVLVLFKKEILTSPIDKFSDISVGSVMEINNNNIFITEKGEAIVVGSDGEIPFKVIVGESVKFIDGNKSGEVVSIEFTESEIIYSKGREVFYSDFNFN